MKAANWVGRRKESRALGERESVFPRCLACYGRVSQPTPTGFPPFIFQLIFGVRVYFGRGCRTALGLLELHLFTLLAGAWRRTCELSYDVISLPVQCFAGNCTATGFVSRYNFRASHAHSARKVTVSCRAREFRLRVTSDVREFGRFYS